jgi:hypothetical protein
MVASTEPVTRYARRTSLAAALIWSAMSPASGQTGAADTYTATVQELCRQYAAAAVPAGMSSEFMFTQCMLQRHCGVPLDSSGYQCEPPGPTSWHGGGF